METIKFVLALLYIISGVIAIYGAIQLSIDYWGNYYRHDINTFYGWVGCATHSTIFIALIIYVCN